VSEGTRDQVWPAVTPGSIPSPSRLKNGFVLNDKDKRFLERMEFWHENVSKQMFKNV